MTIGFIGLGNLGKPIANNLLESGHEVFLFNRTAGKAAELVVRGGNASKNIPDLASKCNIVFTMVSDDAALRSVTEGDEGLAANLQPGAIHVSMSTILPQTAADLSALHAQNNQDYVAAPVFGRPEAAKARKLNFVMSGHAGAKEKIIALLKDAGGAGVYDFGESATAANTVKLCGNFLIAAALEAIGESAALATASGVDARAMWNMFSQTLFNTPLYQNYSNIILQRHFEPAAFTAKLGLKDLNLVLEQAVKSGEQLPMAELLKTHLQALVDRKKENVDWSAISVGRNN